MRVWVLVSGDMQHGARAGQGCGHRAITPRGGPYLHLFYNCVQTQFLSDLWSTNRERAPRKSLLFHACLTPAQTQTHTGTTEGAENPQ